MYTVQVVPEPREIFFDISGYDMRSDYIVSFVGLQRYHSSSARVIR